MLLPDQTYEGVGADASGGRDRGSLPALLSTHRVRPEFFCANRVCRPRDKRKESTRDAALVTAVAERTHRGSDTRTRRCRSRNVQHRQHRHRGQQANAQVYGVARAVVPRAGRVCGAGARAGECAATVRECERARVVAECAESGAAAECDGSAAPTMATLGLSKVFILDKYFTELQKFWETEKKLQDASSSNEAVHLQRRLLSLSSELVTLRNHLHVGAANGAPGGSASSAPSGSAGGHNPNGQPAVPPRAPHLLPPCSVVQPPYHPVPAPPEARWRSAVGTAGGSGAGTNSLAAPAVATGVTSVVTSGAASGAANGVASGATSDVDDLIHLRGPLTEDAVVRALQTRFYHNKFYTMVGPILVAVNAYTDTSNALTLTAARAHRPELARLVHDAVRHQADTGYPQAIILSGVSGSGKTHASMVLLRRLFDVAGGGPETDAFKHLAAAFTVLRALGTAATPSNSHSSRIGHFIEVQVTDGALYRTKIHCYFLDQTRVVRPPPGERNYHIFYQMLAGLTPDERSRLHLEGYGPRDLRYLSSPQPRRAEPEDAARFHAWKTCLVILGIPFLDVVRVLAAVLLLGNVQFGEGAEGGAEPAGDAELAAAAALLGVSAPALLRGLAARTPARRSARTVRGPASPAAAGAARDALAKALYCRTVATIVRRANSLKRPGSTLGTLSSDSNESVVGRGAGAASGAGSGGATRAGARSMAALNDAVRHATDGFVGILDMFGFEDAAPSRLEHLCANLCAETMQHFYNTHVFKSAAESCREEGVACPFEVEYVDNVPCIDLVSSLRGGLLATLDAECAAGGTSEQYVARVRAAHCAHPRLAEARPPHARRFAVRHYAGEVCYDAAEFLEANRDAVPDDLLAAFDSSTCEFGFATHLFGAELKALAAQGGASGGQFRASPTVVAEGGSTLTQDFHTRLDNLLRTLVHARPHFVRCLRANGTETPMLFERATVARQVRALQVLETTQLMASGYPHRMRFRAFSGRYRALWGRGVERDAGAGCARVLRAVQAAAAPPAPSSPAAVRWALGKRHIFLSEGMRQVLERMRRARRQAAAECIQTAWRRYRGRPRVPVTATAPPPPPAPPARPRPAPIAGTPPPDPSDKCDPTLVKRTCSLFGLDLERPPPLPASRSYTVAGSVKLRYPQRRTVRADWEESAAGAAGAEPVRLRLGDSVLVLGAARRGHLAVQVGGRTVQVPHAVLCPPRDAAPGPALAASRRLPPPPAPPPPPQPPPSAHQHAQLA